VKRPVIAAAPSKVTITIDGPDREPLTYAFESIRDCSMGRSLSTSTTPEEAPSMTTKTPAIESTYDHSRREWNLLIRRPFYMNLRLGRTQNALWVGRGFDGCPSGTTHEVFNRFPLRRA
jgi:hypothetical protein